MILMFQAIALGGASACMLGRFLAGTTESPGDIIMKDGKRVKVYSILVFF